MKLHQIISVAIFAVYLVVTVSVDLFHTEDCMFGDQHSHASNTISSNNPCPACMFLAGHHSTGADYTPALLDAEHFYTSQSLPPSLAIVYRSEWASSIISRAPPSTILS
jgi:hypothetical protein